MIKEISQIKNTYIKCGEKLKVCDIKNKESNKKLLIHTTAYLVQGNALFNKNKLNDNLLFEA